MGVAVICLWYTDEDTRRYPNNVLTVARPFLQLGLELVLRHTLAHCRSRRHAAGNRLHQVVHVIGAAPLRKS